MRAIRQEGSRIYLDARASAPEPGPGEAVVRPTRVALGPPDAAASVGGPARTLGREFVGVVERVNEDADREVRKRWEGKRVVGSGTIVCGRCDMCRAGLPAHCRARRALGTAEWDGCLAERFRIPLRNLVEIPREVDDDRAVFAEPVAAAAHTAQLVRVEGKPYVTVVGDTAEALLTAQVLVRLNASVRLLGSEPRRFGLCEKWGIKHRHMGEVGRRADQDVVVECTGTASGLDLALHLVRPRGKVVLAAPGRVEAVSLAPLVEREAELIGARAGSPADAAGLLARAQVDVLPLITRRVKLADAAAAVAAAAAPEQIRILVEI